MNQGSCKRGLKVLRGDVTGLSNMAGLQPDRSEARKFTTILKMFSSVREADRKAFQVGTWRMGLVPLGAHKPQHSQISGHGWREPAGSGLLGELTENC
ncbi:hypothetical protein FOMG_18866 [Fusarium oxysporum f. sp. melonis 26406]|uniref:Uncharacterized protein n=1 Tax=Fusarium oxysporum f. sp. melonis 26406 TaxID=1089452 RepID=W9ZTH5_FUSOX|nr:hypothetical protein FOMG_18866 [Fusarium oxysporum f. sp. melonis 26406]